MDKRSEVPKRPAIIQEWIDEQDAKAPRTLTPEGQAKIDALMNGTPFPYKDSIPASEGQTLNS